MQHWSQLHWGVRNLCGQSCAAILVNAVKGREISPLAVGQQTNTADGSFTNFVELRAMLTHFGVVGTYRQSATLQWHRDVLARGGRAVTLVDYRKIVNKAPGFAGYRYAHFVIPVAIDGERVWLHDPLRPDGPTWEPLASFEAAINARSLWLWQDPDDPDNTEDRENMSNQALVVENVARRMGGVNINPRDPKSRPAASRLAGLEYVRFAYLVTEAGFDEAFRFYAKYIDEYRAAGLKVIVVVGHQFVGERIAGINWDEMNTRGASDPRWKELEDKFIDALHTLVGYFAGDGVYWQIWNEQDTPFDPAKPPKSAVPMPAGVWGRLMKRAHEVISTIDPSGAVVTGGFCSGEHGAVQYYNAAGKPPCDFFGFHAYGEGAGGHYAIYGTLTGALAVLKPLGKRVLLTEVGVLNFHQDPASKVGAYASALIDDAAKSGVADGVVWFAWAYRQTDDSYGVLDGSGNVIQPIWSALTKPVDAGASAPTRTALAAGTYKLEYTTWLNLRASASTTSAIVGRVNPGDVVEVTSVSGEDDGTYLWQSVKFGALSGKLATVGGAWKLQPYTPPVGNPALRQHLLGARAELDAALLLV